MHSAYRVRKIVSVEPHQAQGWVAVGQDDRQASCPEPVDAGDKYLGDGITRAEVMEYLSQTYGPVFVADLVKHLS